MFFLIYILALTIHLNANTPGFPVCVEVLCTPKWSSVIFQYFKVSVSKGLKICNKSSLKVLKKVLKFHV